MTASVPEEEKAVTLQTIMTVKHPVVSLQHYSSFTKLIRVTAWVLRFLHRCKAQGQRHVAISPTLTVQELHAAETYWYQLIQEQHFSSEITALKSNQQLPRSSPLLPLHPILNSDGLLCVSGRLQNAEYTLSSKHPVILHSNHPITKLVIRSEHIRLFHAGPTLFSCMLNRRFHLIGWSQLYTFHHTCMYHLSACLSQASRSANGSTTN